MGTEVLKRRFAAIGARLNVVGPPIGAPRIGLGWDARGEFFDVRFAGNGRLVALEVVAVSPSDRHLLLLVRNGEEKSKFLCGHDERHWFVAAVPESARGVTGVVTAKAALQPDAVRALVERVRPKDRFRRRNEAYIRQGEWFFVPATLRPEPTEAEVLRNEPLSRGRGKAHMLQLAFRTGGQTVYVNRHHPTGISAQGYAKLTPKEQRGGQWMRMVRDPQVYAKGTVRHPDHATIQLPAWHRVLMNTEQRARAMQHVAFLD